MKVKEVKYTVFSPQNNDDQSLLDAELDLRKNYPRLLAVLYSKDLWTFALNGDDPPNPNAKFGLKASPVKSFDPHNMYKSNAGTPSSLMSLLCATFIKAIKKQLVLTLVLRRELIPFGSAGLLPGSSHILHIEPKLVETGDLLVSLTTRQHNFELLNEYPVSQRSVNKENTIYLVPSGIRAYLTDETLAESTASKPLNATSIAESLETLHGIQIDVDACTWIRLIPNLAHLNGMTAPVADFFKPVPNNKFLVWPAELCVVQPASKLRATEINWKKEFTDPLSLIDSFVKLKATATTKTPSAVPTAHNTPADVDHLHHTHHIETPSSKPTPDGFPLQATAPITEEPRKEEELSSNKDEWDDLDAELFGGDSPNAEPDFDFFDEPKSATNVITGHANANTDTLMLDNDIDLDDDDDLGLHADLASELEMLAGQDEDGAPESLIPIDTEDKPATHTQTPDPYDIPLHEMMMPSTPPYTDPGAPLPVQSPKTVSRKRSIFSPLNFNPIIKSNVDDKYANGGKFHVASSDTPTGETSGGTPATVLDEGFGKDEGDDDDSEDEGDSESGSESESDEDEVGNSIVTGDDLVSSNMSIPPEGSIEPDLKRIKTDGTPSTQSFEGVISENKAGSLSPGVASNGNPNIWPFLLRMIPLHTMPDQVYLDSPNISKEGSEELVDTLIDQVVWDDSCLSEVIPRGLCFEESECDNLHRAIALVYPEFHPTSLSEYSGIPYNKPQKTPTVIESPLSSFKAPDYSHGTEFITTPPQVKEAQEPAEESKSCFVISQPKVKVKRLHQEISVNASAVHLWNTLSFGSLTGQKDVRVLMLSPKEVSEQATYFLSSLVQVYKKCQLGEMEKMVYSAQGAPGLITAGFNDVDYEDQVLSGFRAAHQILVRGMNYKDIVVIFPDYGEDLTSTISITKIFLKIKQTLLTTSSGKTLPIKVHLKIISSSFVTHDGVFSVLSINRLARMALCIFNNVCNPQDTFAKLSSSPSYKINFQLTERPVAEKILAQDSFIHLAFERSIDKEWCVAAWADNKANVRKVKAWAGSTKTKEPLEKVMDEMWQITISLSSKLKGRKYLVLTRSNGMITDDELLQLKRMSSKSKDLTLILVSMNQNTRLLLKANDPGFPFNQLFNQDESFSGALTSNKVEAAGTVGSSTGLTPSTIFTPQPAVNSPDLFTMGRATTHDSPSEGRHADDGSVINDVSDTVYGLTTDYASPLANTPTRLSIKTGFLIKPVKHTNNKLQAFELNLLSCPSTFSSWDLMHELLIQCRNLATIGELYGVTHPNDSLIPWHVKAVDKAMKCLTHVKIDNGSQT